MPSRNLTRSNLDLGLGPNHLKLLIGFLRTQRLKIAWSGILSTNSGSRSIPDKLNSFFVNVLTNSCRKPLFLYQINALLIYKFHLLIYGENIVWSNGQQKNCPVPTYILLGWMKIQAPIQFILQWSERDQERVHIAVLRSGGGRNRTSDRNQSLNEISALATGSGLRSDTGSS
jgi:hypothetical protein